MNRTSNYTSLQGTFTDTTKTEKSKRSMKLPPFIMDLLKTYKDEQDKERERLGDKWEDNDRLFVQWNGSPMCPHTPYNWLRKFCKKSGLPFYGVHHYRHLFASLAIGEGVDIVTLSGALGHTNPNVTLGTYSHLLQNAQEKISSAVENALDFSKMQKSQAV
ncbi:MAG: tyrosine-type recombinase/integrase [Oscillospiraceae bacterium]|nr:tyrosine-type recombinase/integrase [Oscillospiraceae bacterium]